MLAWQLCDFQGIRTSIAKKPYIFVIFQGGSDPLPTVGPHMFWLLMSQYDRSPGCVTGPQIKKDRFSHVMAFP